ncbi:DUF3592 domain-containing protein [Aeromicrobium sp.]|uniref:DUF3592 domain-containing protein n=1 Tax=Aeromicrobium sp. TaxID=1871063 RepID=UPI003C4A6DFF
MSLTLIPVALLVLGAVLVGWGLRRRAALGLLPGGWLPVTGTVVDAIDRTRIEYRTPDGRRLRLQAPVGAAYTAGAEVEILVDPQDPSRARLAEVDDIASRLVVGLVALGTVLLVIGALAAVAFA